MKRNVGLWIDHKKAVIFSLADEGAEIKRISSKPKKDLPLLGKTQSKSGEGHGDEGYAHLLDSYYDEVLSYMKDAESLMIFGPGDAKVELKKRLEKIEFRGHIFGLESAEAMTDNEIVAKVRQRFLR